MLSPAKLPFTLEAHSLTIRTAWRSALIGFQRLAVPAQCPSCSTRIERPGHLCAACAEQFESEQEPLTIELETYAIHAIAPFSGVWANVVRAYKQDPTPGVADLVEPLFARLLRERLDAPAPILVPVPMAPVRRRERGFSPAERLARSMARVLGWPNEPHLLSRVRYRRPLRGLTAAERRAEIQGAIVPGPAAIVRADLCSEGPARVVLIDDVLTTGSTLDACATAVRSLAPSIELAAAVLGATPAGER